MFLPTETVTHGLEVRSDTLVGILQAMGMFLTLITAYVTGLYFFLGRAALVFRLVGAGVLGLAFLFVGMMLILLKQVLDDLEACETCPLPEGDGVYLVLHQAIDIGWLEPIATALIIILGFGSWIVLTAMTLFPRNFFEPEAATPSPMGPARPYARPEPARTERAPPTGEAELSPTKDEVS